jgi:hypothetical protein
VKSIIKIFLAIFFFIFTAINSPIAVEAVGALSQVQSTYITITEPCKTESNIISNNKEMFIEAVVNNQTETITNASKQNDNDFGLDHNLYYQNKNAKFILSAVLFRSCNCTFYNLSSYLKEEINIRAP